MASPRPAAHPRTCFNEGVLTVGQILDDRYEILALLAEGGMGAVYRARRTLLGDEVAIKIISTGQTGAGHIGVLVTKTLVISGEGGTVMMPGGGRGAMLRAYDKATGEERGAVYMPGAQTGSPMTYMLNGKQYIVVAVSSSTMPGELIAYSLP